MRLGSAYGIDSQPSFWVNFWKVLPMTRQVRKPRAIAIAKVREDQNKMIVRTAALGLVASFLGYGLMVLGFLG